MTCIELISLLQLPKWLLHKALRATSVKAWRGPVAFLVDSLNIIGKNTFAQQCP